MKEKLTLTYRSQKIEVTVPQKNLLYTSRPKDLPRVKNEEKHIKESLRNPIHQAPLCEKVKKGMKVVIIGDDLTRFTPRRKIFPPLLDALNDAGVPDKDMTVLIALGTHRYMNDEEIEACYGKGVTKRVEVLNHEWREENNFVYAGTTRSCIPVKVNKIAYQADYLIGVGSVVPHLLAGYGGGGKIIQPGICSWETTGKTHMLPFILPAGESGFFDLAGNPENKVRLEMEEVAEIVGLDFVVNVVINSKQEIIKVISGDPVKAHREGVRKAREIYESKIHELANIVIISSYPADIDYWQGVKPLCYAQHGIEEKGTIILLAGFPDGISPTHNDLEKYGNKSYKEIEKLINENKFEDLVCASGLLTHTLLTGRSEIVCVSEGLSIKQKENLGFKHANTVEEALEIALVRQGKNAKIGVIDYGGDVLPRLQQ